MDGRTRTYARWYDLSRKHNGDQARVIKECKARLRRDRSGDNRELLRFAKKQYELLRAPY